MLTIDNATTRREPAADIVDVRINGASAGPCSNIDATGRHAGGRLRRLRRRQPPGLLQPDRHLREEPGRRPARRAGATLTPVALGAIPAADFTARLRRRETQGAAAPHWRAGGLRLTVPDLRDAFPETCCYQIELRVYKRTIVSCNHDYTPKKLSYYSLTVVV